MASVGRKITVEELECLRCHYTWFPRIVNAEVKIPETCPNDDCRSPYWNKNKERFFENQSTKIESDLSSFG